LNFTPWWSILKLGKDVVEELKPGMNWKKLLESISESVNDHLRIRNDYLVAENRLLRNQIDGRVRLTDNERQELAEIGVKLGKQALAEIATVATPDAILAWHRTFVDQKVDPSEPRQSVGRPRVDKEIEDLVVRMVRENRTWGYDRIQTIRCGKTLLGSPVAAGAPADARPPRSHEMNKVVHLSDAPPGPTRASPLRYRRRFRGLPHCNYCEAA
jgi:hypothetical protein